MEGGEKKSNASSKKIRLEIETGIIKESGNFRQSSSKDIIVRARATSAARKNDGPKERCFGCKLLGFRGFVCLLLSAGIGGLLIYAYTVFSARPWYILLVATFALCLPLKFIYLILSLVFYKLV